MTYAEMARYVVAVRAPKSGIEGMADGSWHIVTDVVGNRWTERRRAVAMIPYVVSAGGELVMYEIDKNDRIVGGVPICIGRGPTSVKLPVADEINAINEAIANSVHTLSKEFALGGIYHYERLRREDRLRNLKPKLRDGSERNVLRSVVKDGRAVAGFAVAMLLGLGTIGYFVQGSNARTVLETGVSRPNTEVRVTTEADYDPRYLASLRSGAFQKIRPNKDHPEMMEVIRVYPEADGKVREEIVQRFPAELYRRAPGRIPASKIPWFDPKTVAANQF